MAVGEEYLCSSRRYNSPSSGSLRIALGKSSYAGRISPRRKRIEVFTENDLAKMQAVAVIEMWWWTIKDKRVFQLLKQAVCTSEYSLTQEILRKVNPAEAMLLADPTIQAKVKFRFGGEQFPPYILFKIYMSMTDRGRIIYMSGSKIIKPASEAASDARCQMGNRKYYDQMLEDACQHYEVGITDEVDVTTMKEYMQLMSNVDERPAYLGGRDNTWRRLDLTVLPRCSYFHNLIDFLDKSRILGNVSLHQLRNYTRSPLTQDQQLDNIKMVSAFRDKKSPSPLSPSPLNQPKARKSRHDGASKRSKQARKRAEMMRKVYGRKGEEEVPKKDGDEDGDEDVDDLYQWTQSLSLDDIR